MASAITYKTSTSEELPFKDTMFDQSISSHVYDPSTMEGTLTFDVDVLEIKANAFAEGFERLTYMDMGGTIRNVRNHAFANCVSLSEVVLSANPSFTEIEDYVFEGCSALTSINFPSNVTTIGKDSFHNCTALKTVKIDGTITTIGDYAFEACTSMTSMPLPEGLTDIGIGSFHKCEGLNTVSFPDSLENIGAYAFKDCKAISSITIPDNVSSIGKGAFRECSGIQTLAINCKSIQVLDEYTFTGCTSLTSVTFSDEIASLSNIQSYCFSGCTSLTSISLPDCVNCIGAEAFARCPSLSSVTLPGQPKPIGESMFYGCSSLTSITIPSSIMELPKYAFFGCEALATINMENNNIGTIGAGAFADCHALDNIEDVSVSAIGNYAFLRSGVRKIGIDSKSTVQTISKGAFAKCTNLTEIIIPENVKDIEVYACQNCTSATVIKVYAQTPPNINPLALAGVPIDCPIWIPSGTSSLYKSANVWRERGEYMSEKL